MSRIINWFVKRFWSNSSYYSPGMTWDEYHTNLARWKGKK